MGLKGGLTMLLIVGLLTLGYAWVANKHWAEVDAYAACVNEKFDRVMVAPPARVKRKLNVYSEHLAPHRTLQLKWWAEGKCKSSNEKWDDMFDNNPRTDDW